MTPRMPLRQVVASPLRLALPLALLATSPGGGSEPAGVPPPNPEHLWIPNGGEGTVSKLDASTGQEVARYATVTHDPARVIDHVLRSFPAWGAANRPDHVAVDGRGDLWVANLAPGFQPSLTKIWGDEWRCVDKDGDLEIETSREVNGLPGIQLADGDEFLGEVDECIAFTVVLGANQGEARAVVVDRGDEEGSGGDVWVGMRLEEAFYQIDGDSGAMLMRVPPTGPSGNSPFAAAIDSTGVLWAADDCCTTPRLWRIDTLTGSEQDILPPEGLDCAGSFAVAVDLDDKIWLAGHPCSSALRYDPSDGSWEEVPTSQTGYLALGVAPDRRGNIWVGLAKTGTGRVARVDAGTLVSTGAWDNSGSFPYGVGVAFDGDVWSISSTADVVSRLHLDPVSGQPAPHPTTGNVVDLFPVGDTIEPLGDFTGLAYRTIVRPELASLVFADGFESGSTSIWSLASP